MLDFYLLPENDIHVEEKELISYVSENKLVFAGGIEAEVFERLQKFGLINEIYDYYSDFIWDTSEIKTLLKHIKTKQIRNRDAIILQTILEKAKVEGSGLFALCD